MLAGSDWLETNEWNLHRHDQTEEIEGDVGNIDPGDMETKGGGIEGETERERERERKREKRRDLLGGMGCCTIYETAFLPTVSLLYTRTCNMKDDIHVHVHVIHNTSPNVPA